MANKSTGLRAAVAKLFAKLLAGKTKHNSLGKGHLYEGNIGYKASYRSTQSRRRKMERRTGNRRSS